MKSELDVIRPDAQRSLTPSRERELGAIVTDMWSNAETLLRAELDLGLAKLDLRVEKLKHSLLLATLGGAIVYAGVLLLLAAAVLGLSQVMAPWLSALLLGVVVTAVGATLLMRGEDTAAAALESDEHSPRETRAMKEAIK